MNNQHLRRFVLSALAASLFAGGSAFAQELGSPQPIPWMQEEGGESAVGYSWTGEELPRFVVVDTLFEHLLYAFGQGGGAWQHQVLGALGVSAGSAAEAELEGILLEARVPVREAMHKHFDPIEETAQFQAEQRAYMWRKMTGLATVHAELLGMLAARGIGTEGLDAYIAEHILPSTTLFVAADGARAKDTFHMFSAFDDLLEQRLRDEPFRFAKALMKSTPADSILVSASQNFTPCGEGLETPKGQHSTKALSVYLGYRMTIAGSLDRCYVGGLITVPEDACSNGVEYPSVGTVVSCATSGTDHACGPKFRAFSRGQMPRNGTTPLTKTTQTSCKSC